MAKGAKKSRLQQMRDERQDPEYHPPMPPCDALYLVGYLFDVGPALPSGFGPVPISEQELVAWQSNTGIELPPWESRVLKQLSLDFIVQQQESAKLDCPPPWQEIDEDDRFAVAKRIKSIFRE